MNRPSWLITLAGAICVGIGVFSLIDAYWRFIGVALGYPPLWSTLVGASLLLVGIVCLFAGQKATPPGDPNKTA